ncbi:MAG: ammonium transporter [Oscillospiraceae bacterium]|nr:ammonium transporter [Oscillospiraceae bacterium]
MEFSSINTLWVIFGASLVFIMQAGFAMLETGFTRSKNAGNIIMKNLLDLSIGLLVYWIIGYGIMYGSGGSFAGVIDFFSKGSYDTGSIPKWCHLIYSAMFCATAATIVSGSMAERTKFGAYLIYSAVASSVVFPVVGHWVWGNGWLSAISIDGVTGFKDYAGSSIVHLVGGTAALIGASFIGPRIGKYGKDGKARAIPGHSVTLGALGIFLLWFGWLGFNICSGKAIDTDEAIATAGSVLINTCISAACALIAAMSFLWVRYRKPDVSMTLNGALGGLVAITGASAYVSVECAAIIGIISGIITVCSIEFVDNVLKIDDPVGAIGVHGMNGLWGTIAVGLFSETTGSLFTEGTAQLKIQLLGAVCIIGWTCLILIPTFFILKKTIGIRVSREDEVAGLDISEHALESSYADFVIVDDQTLVEFPENVESLPEEAIPLEMNINSEDTEIYMVTIICKQEKFDALKNALDDIGVTGITVTQALGCGTQKGFRHYYRGVKLEARLLPRVKVEIAISKIPVSAVINAARKALYTGHIGDGKIFVSPIYNVVRVRTGVSGYDALQDDRTALEKETKSETTT